MSVARFVLISVCALLGSRMASAQASEIRLRPVQIGDTTVAGFVIPTPKSAAGYFIEVYDISNGGRDFLDRKAVDSFDNAGGFTVQLTSALGPGQQITVTGPDVTPRSIATSRFNGRAVLRPQLFDGAQTVRGYVGDRTGVALVRVKVLRSGLESDSLIEQYLQIESTTEFDDEGEFKVTLDEPLIAGQIVTAQAFTSTQQPGDLSEPVTVTDPGSWGRARAYFAGGVVFSKDRNDFSDQDLSLAFAIDKGWLQKADFKLAAEEAVRRLAPTDASGDARGKWIPRQLNSFFDARLTALPVVEPPATTKTETTTPTAGGGTSTTTTEAQTKFVDSRKGAMMQVGVYLPIYGPQTAWVHEGAVNALFVAPLFRYGIQTIPGDEDGTPTTNVEGEPDDVFNSWGGGIGIGHHKLSGTTNQTPEIISYLHLTWGKAEAFKFKRNPSDPNDPIVDSIRTMVEGRLKIPNTALQVGFDANLGDGRDDIRFIFGTRFDIGEAFSRLRSFAP